MHLENLTARPGRIAAGAHDDQDVTAHFQRTLLTSFDLGEIKRAFAETTATLLEIMTSSTLTSLIV